LWETALARWALWQSGAEQPPAGEPLTIGQPHAAAWASRREVAELVALRARLLNSARILGALRRIEAITQEHTAVRRQFGRPLASFQMVSAHLAEISSQVALVSSLLEEASAAHDARSPEPSTGNLAIVAAQAATAVARSTHQCHGAIGITQEYWLQQFTRRVLAWRDAFGSGRSTQRETGKAAVLSGPSAAWAATTSRR
jgi:acyl-CoA dehydrogenase